MFSTTYIPPSTYRTTERYVTYVDAIARSGYIVFKPDLRGHGNSDNAYLADLSEPLQFHHSTTDADVPVAWSKALLTACQAVDEQLCTLYTYPGDNHNISANFSIAMQRTVAFFDEHVKGQ